MTTYSMPTLSSLELMLQKIQQLENEPKDVPPPLPVRPVSKGRLPPRARRLLSNNFQRSGSENEHNNGSSSFKWGMLESKEAIVESAYQKESEDGDVVAVAAYARKSAEELIQINRLDDTREGKVQGALVLQRCFRAYQARCYYNELKSSVISLQSFIRGENARNTYQHLVARLKAIITMQKQKKQYFQNDGFEGQHTAILHLQSGNKKNLPDEKTKAKQVHDKSNQDTKDHSRVPYSFLVNLQRQVLRTEAALRNSEAENAALLKNIKQYEKRWMEYEVKMKSMEKMWQDQLTSMQISLAAAKKGLAAEKTMRKSPRRSLEQLFDLPHEDEEQVTEAELQVNSRANTIIHQINQHNIVLDDDDRNIYRIKSGRCTSNKDIGIEFQKLTHKFDAWKKEYEIKLEETKATMKKLSHSKTEKCGKRWWERQRNRGS